MPALVIILIALAALTVYDYVSGFQLSISVVINGTSADIRVWYPFLRVSADWQKDAPVIVARIFRLRLFQKRLHSRRRRKRAFDMIRLIQAIQLRKLSAYARYGMHDPFMTGVSFAALNAAAVFIDMGSIVLRPYFAVQESFADISAHVNFSLSHTIINYLTRRTTTWSRT